MRQPIQQQYYTRAREGVFRSNEGYDTIAKSAQLDHGFIKKTLHPFCVYDAPKELQEKSEKDLGKYPKALLLFYSETGEMILGQSAYVGADFTGQRNTFFSHHYVIPPSRQAEYWLQPSRIVGAEGFVTEHDPAAGKELPELGETPYRDVAAGQRAKQILQRLGLEETMYKRLLAAVMTAVAGKRKVFVVPAAEIAGLGEWAKELVYVLYLGLPYAHRRRFGFLTYMSEPVSRKYLHLMVVPPGSLRPGDTAIDKDYQFDFAAQRFLHTELAAGEQLYLDFIWEYLDRPEELARFQQFAEEVLAGVEPKRALGLQTYHELTAIYLTERGKAYPYERHKSAVLRLLADYLGMPGLQHKERLHSLFRGLFQTEKQLLAAGELPSAETLEAMIDYASLVKDDQLGKEFIRHLLLVIIKGAERGELHWMEHVYRYAQKDGKLFRQLILAIITSEQLVKPLFLDYLDRRLQDIKTVGGLLEELSFWLTNVPPLREYRAFLASMSKRLGDLFKTEQDLVGSLRRIHQYVAEGDFAGHAAATLLDAADQAALQSLKLEQLSTAEAELLSSLLREKSERFVQQLDWTSRQKHAFVLQLARLWEQPDEGAADEIFAQMEQDRITLFQQLLLQRVKELGCSERVYPLLIVAFFQEDGGYRFDLMIRFLREQCGNEALPAFVRWSLRQEVFVTGVRLQTPYRQALKQHFIQADPRALRKKAARQTWYGIKHSDLKRLLDEVRDETANGLVRFFRKPAGKAVIVLALLVGAGSTAAALLLGKEEPVPVIEPQPEEPSVSTPPPQYGPPMPQKMSPADGAAGDSESDDESSTPLQEQNTGEQDAATQTEEPKLP